MRLLSLAFALLCLATAAHAETGYDLWLRYAPVEAQYKSQYGVTLLQAPATSPTLSAAVAELNRGLSGMLGAAPPVENRAAIDGTLLVGTPASLPAIAALKLPLAPLGGEGYLIRNVVTAGHKAVVIAANSDVGVLYGVFAYLRMIQMRQPITDVDSAPKTQLRVLNHWDNRCAVDGSPYRAWLCH